LYSACEGDDVPTGHGIKAVFYDLDGTLHAENPPQLEVFSKRAIELGLRITEEDWRRAARWEYYYFSQSEEFISDQLDFSDEMSFWNNYVRRQLLALGASPPQAEELGPRLFQYMYEHYKPEDIVLPGVYEVLAALKDRGYILGLISNRENTGDRRLEEFDFKRYFDLWLSADQIDLRKPDKRIFERALDLAGIHANQAMHVGDNYFTDVVGPRSVGILPILLDPRGVFEQLDCHVIRSHEEILELL
jgi:HAD superfamily hydrolase (TIGR01549 family)